MSRLKPDRVRYGLRISRSVTNSCINMFALIITVDVSAMLVCLFQFTSKVMRVNSVWALLTMKEKLFTSVSGRCVILS